MMRFRVIQSYMQESEKRQANTLSNAFSSEIRVDYPHKLVARNAKDKIKKKTFYKL